MYRGTDHGFGAASFHDKCDGNIKTLTIIKTISGYIFGGYTEAEWSSNQCYSCDSNTFLFSLTNAKNITKKIICSQPQNAIFSNPAVGPVFGCNNLVISDHSNLNNNSCYNLSNNFIENAYPKLFEWNHSSFQTLEIEIYSQ